MNKPKPSPPQWAVHIMKWYCFNERHEELLGDLEELFYRQIAMGKPPYMAKASFLWNVIKCCKPYAYKGNFTNQDNNPNFFAMIFSYLKVILRGFHKNLSYNLLNLAGLALGFATFLLVAIYVHYETGFEKFHKNAENIHRLTVHYFSDNGYNTHFARVDADWVNTIPDEVPEVTHLVRFQNHEPKYVRVGEAKFTQENAYTTDANVFDVFSFELLHGDPQTALKEPFSVVVSESLARKYFGNTDVVGKDLHITRYWIAEEEPYRITGVMADLPTNTHLPIEMLTSFRNANERSWWAYTYLLINDDASPLIVKDKIMALLVKNQGEEAKEGTDYVLQPLRDIHLNSELAREIKPNGSMLYVNLFIGVGLFILVLAVINYINLSSVIALGRIKEVGIRRVMGSGKKQLVWYSVTESMIITTLAVVLGWILANAILGSFESLLGVQNIMLWHQQLVLMVVAILTCGIVAGVYPAYLLSTLGLTGVLKGSKSIMGTKGSRGFGFRKILVTGQFAICILLVGSAFIGRRQFEYLNESNLKSTDTQLLAMTAVPDAVKDMFPVFKEAMRGKPGIQGVSACLEVPSREIRDGGNVAVDGIHDAGDKNLPVMDIQVIDHDFIEVAGLNLITGTNLPKSISFSPLPEFDGQESVQKYLIEKRRAYIINETAMRRLGWTDPQEAIGKIMDWKQGYYALQKGPIVGVIKDYHQESLKNKIDPTIMVFEPLWLRTFLVKVETEKIQQTLAEVENTWNLLFPSYPFEFEFVDDLYQQLYHSEQQQLRLLYSLCGMAIFIAFLGLFGLVAYAMKTRNKEIAIRRVLGATFPKIIALFSKEYMVMLVVACAIAIPVSYQLIHYWLAGYAYHVEISWGSYVITLALIVKLVVGTVLYHSFRSISINPISGLREE